MNEANIKKKDYSVQLFVAISVVESIVFLIVRDKIISGVGRYLASLLAGLITYFAYVAYLKSKIQETNWTGMDIFAGFLMAGVGAWGPTILILIFGDGPTHYSGY